MAAKRNGRGECYYEEELMIKGLEEKGSKKKTALSTK
jgi:hypothetical protein